MTDNTINSGDSEIDRVKEYRDRIIAKCDDRGDIGVMDDGFYHFWPDTGGSMSSDCLRVIADELDRRNETWVKSIDEYFKGNPG